LEVDVAVGRQWRWWMCGYLAGDGWWLVCVCGVLSKFLVVKVRAASSNLIWRYKILEGLRSDATVTVTP
jgi:hypothetical protein